MCCSDCMFVIAPISDVGRSDAVEVMQRNFWGTIKPDGNDRGADTDRGVPHHAVVFPRPGAHMPRQNRIKRDRDRPGQTDLPP